MQKQITRSNEAKKERTRIEAELQRLRGDHGPSLDFVEKPKLSLSASKLRVALITYCVSTTDCRTTVHACLEAQSTKDWTILTLEGCITVSSKSHQSVKESDDVLAIFEDTPLGTE